MDVVQQFEFVRDFYFYSYETIPTNCVRVSSPRFYFIHISNLCCLTLQRVMHRGLKSELEAYRVFSLDRKSEVDAMLAK